MSKLHISSIPVKLGSPLLGHFALSLRISFPNPPNQTQKYCFTCYPASSLFSFQIRALTMIEIRASIFMYFQLIIENECKSQKLLTYTKHSFDKKIFTKPI